MARKTVLFSAAALVVLAAASGSQIPGRAHAAGCAARDGIDGSAIVAARKQMASAGFHGIYELTKGCDSSWHAKATKDGIESRIALSPRGEVTREDDGIE